MFSAAAHKEMSKLVKQARVDAGLTQADIAKKLGYKSPQFVSNWERAESLPPLTTLPKIARLTKRSYSDFKRILLSDLDRTLETHNKRS